MAEPAAIIFDFDGVILESAELKTAAFARLFSDRPEHLPAIIALHRRLGGISRFRKFELIYRDILCAPLAPDERCRLGLRFESLVATAIATCPEVAGARAFLAAQHDRRPLFVVSGTPETELRAIVHSRGLAGHFAEVHGSPREKPAIVDDVLTRHRLAPASVVFIGDAWSDYQAARQTGLSFIGRVAAGDANPFPDTVPVIPDLTGLAAALAAIEAVEGDP